MTIKSYPLFFGTEEVLINFLLRQGFEEALEWHTIKDLKEICFSDQKVLADTIKEILY
jgi:hypothetical protein